MGARGLAQLWAAGEGAACWAPTVWSQGQGVRASRSLKRPRFGSSGLGAAQSSCLLPGYGALVRRVLWGAGLPRQADPWTSVSPSEPSWPELWQVPLLSLRLLGVLLASPQGRVLCHRGWSAEGPSRGKWTGCGGCAPGTCGKEGAACQAPSGRSRPPRRSRVTLARTGALGGTSEGE